MTLSILTKFKNGELDPFAILHALQPVAWFLSSLPVFIITIHQPVGSLTRWGLLPLNVLGPAMCFLTSTDIIAVLPGLEWLWAFTSMVYTIHALSGLYLEDWQLPIAPSSPANGSSAAKASQTSVPASSPTRWEWLNGYKHWNNPRRLPLLLSPDRIGQTSESKQPSSSSAKHATVYERITFCARRLGIILLLWAGYLFYEFGAMYLLLPLPKDFEPHHQTYLHLQWDKQAKIRAVYCLHWAWLTYFILSVANALMSILFVGILRWDEPAEWPHLYGNPLEAYSLQRFWGVFWHKIGSPSQRNFARVAARKVLPPGGAGEKVFVAFCVFFVSGGMHFVVTWYTDPKTDPRADAKFLLLNFAGGLVEFAARRVFGGLLGGGKGGKTRWGLRIVGYLWVLAFFYCVAPPWQWPILRAELKKRVPDVKFKVNLPRRNA